MQLLVALQVSGIQAGVFTSGAKCIAHDTHTSGPFFRNFRLPGQDLVLQTPNLNESFETSQADLGIGGDGQRVAFGACGGKLCPDMGCGCQIPKSQGSGQIPVIRLCSLGEHLIGEDTIPMVISRALVFPSNYEPSRAEAVFLPSSVSSV